MATLNCEVERCAYNKNTHCCKSSIEVGGSNALSSEGTNCQSFTEGSSSMTSSVEDLAPNLNMSIGCSAAHCAHNENSRCVSNFVDISSMSGQTAYNEKGTQCSSFIPK